MKSKITIFETGIKEGIFSINKKFYNEENEEKIKGIFLNTREKAMKKYNLSGKKIVTPRQKEYLKDIDYEDGKYLKVDLNFKDEDLWYTKYYCDILLLEENNKGIIMGHPMADCPILIVEDRLLGVTALSHCGAYYINKLLPIDTIKSLMNEYNSKKDNLYVYVGSCIKKDNYIYDTYPKWATNKDVWNGFIIEKKDGFHIDMEGAIIKQLKDFGIKNIEVSNIDTFNDNNYYSHVGVYKGNKNKLGENFVGCFYNNVLDK